MYMYTWTTAHISLQKRKGWTERGAGQRRWEIDGEKGRWKDTVYRYIMYNMFERKIVFSA